jgi:hypothetical protein
MELITPGSYWRRMKTVAPIFTVLLVFQLTGCAYMFHGNTDQITIQSVDPQAELYIENALIGKGTASASVERNRKYSVTAKKAGCSDQTVQTGDKFDAISLLGLFLDLGIVSILIVDNASGAMWKTYPLVYHVNPVCPGPPK